MNKKIFFLCLVCFTFFACKSTKTLTPHEMIKENKIDEAKSQFMMPSDINSVDENGNTVLHLAAQINDPDLCTFFIIKGADTELKNNNSDTALHIAIKNNSFEAAEAILKMDCKSLFARDANGLTALDLGLETDSSYYDIFINKKSGELVDEKGQTIVHYFVNSKNLKGIQLCIEKFLPISIADNDGNTPLDLAFKNCDDDEISVQIAAALILGGADEVDTNFSYFQEAVSSRNYSMRFTDGQTPLHFAIINNHIAIAKFLLENDASTQAQDSTGATPLHEAIRYGRTEIAKLLLSAGANVNATDNLGKTPIMMIMPKDKVRELYVLLISYKADLTQKDMYGDSVLHIATMMKVNIDELSILINNGADVNARNKYGVTPLLIAVQSDDLKTVKLLTSASADIHTKDTYGKSPLSMAFAGSSELFEAVINSKNATSQDSDGNTPLHIALLNSAPIAKIMYIIGLTSDVDIRNMDGDSALYIATKNNMKEVGELILAKNADIFASNKQNDSPLRVALRTPVVQDWLITSKTIKATDGSGNSVLHYAAEWEYADAINSLLTKGADIHAKNANGETPLFNAAKSNSPDIIQVIVNGGGEVQARDNLGSTAIHAAVRWDADKSISKLVSLGININSQNLSGKSPLAEAVSSGKYDISKQLILLGADTNSCDTEGVTILMNAIRDRNLASVKLLLENGANPNMQDIYGRNSYHIAAQMQNKDIIKLIRQAGGNPLSRDKNGNTPFSLVLKLDNSIIKEVLGDNTNITDSDGNTPIHIVVKESSSNDKLLNYLIECGYPIDTRNSDGYTALNYAIEKNNTKMALVLLEKGANPFQMIDKKGTNGVTIALKNKNKTMLLNIVKYAGKMTDVQGNTILHYAAKSSTYDVVKTLISYGLDKNVKNIAGDTPYDIAIRWKHSDIATLLKEPLAK